MAKLDDEASNDKCQESIAQSSSSNNLEVSITMHKIQLIKAYL